jgi:transcriptional regulator with XRE-family HTH domain
MLNIFSEELKKAREQAGLSIQQISNKTRIDKKYLELMENGNFSFLPELYVKSFIREYAEIVGLEPEETVKKYTLAKEGRLHSHSELDKVEKEEISTTPPINRPKEAKSKSFVDDNIVSHQEGQSTKKNVNLLIVVASLVVVLITIFAFYYSYNSKEDIIIEETPFEEIVNQDKERFEENNIKGPVDSIAVGDSLTLEIFTKDTTWMFLILDQKIPVEFTLYPNNKKVVKAMESYVGTIGNSGSIKLKLNDKPLDFLGRTNLPRHFRVDRSYNLEYLNARPTLNEQDAR